MFTGIVEELGKVAALEPHATGARLMVNARLVTEDLAAGESIAVNGVCLTAVEISGGGFTADLAPETLKRSNLGDLQPGSLVNLERPLAVGDRLSGHMVQGHVDQTGEFVSLDALGDGNWWLKVRVPADLERYMIHKGSVALDGVSLTIAELDGRDLGVAIIPHTYENTRMCEYAPGVRINVEADLVAKYIEKLLAR